uniref:Charged multivesicular body protein 1B n=1 Tax=Spermophilus dauricus TaxID=99837 RepID=A0A8C9UL47_SPEDA
MEKHLFNLKFAAKELSRSAKKCDKEEKAEKAKIKKAIQKGNMEVARIHAENAIRQKNQAVNFLRMSARVDAVAARVQTAVTMGKVTKSMAGVVKSMDATLKTMNLEKISALMDKFEHQFETLDVQTHVPPASWKCGKGSQLGQGAVCLAEEQSRPSPLCLGSEQGELHLFCLAIKLN